jgi:hypothetical protein
VSSPGGFERVREWATSYPGSTRSVALMRIGLVLVGWAEFGEAVQPHKVAPLLSLFFYVATFAALIGYRAPYAAFASGAAYLLILRLVPSQMLHHTYLLAVTMLLLSLTPCGGSLSLDRLRAVRAARARNEPPPAEEGNLWALRLIGVELSAVLFWSAYHKLALAFLTGDRLEQMLVYFYTGLPVMTPGWAKALLGLAGTSVVLVELSASVLLWLPKYRMKALAACFLVTTFFQVALAIRAFGFLSYVMYLAFVPPETVHRVLSQLLLEPRPKQVPP